MALEALQRRGRPRARRHRWGRLPAPAGRPLGADPGRRTGTGPGGHRVPVTAQLLALALLARVFDPAAIQVAAAAALAGQVAAVLADEPAAAVAAELSLSRGVICLAGGALRVAAQDAA